MTETTTPRPAARFIGQSVTRKEDPPAPHRSRAVRRRRRRSAACCTPRSCAARSPPATITSIDTSAAKAAARCRRRVHVAGLRRSLRRGVARHARRGAARCRRRSRSATCATSATRSRSWSPRAGTSAEDACDLIEVELEPDAGGRRLPHRGRRHRAPRARRLGSPVQRHGRRCRSCRSPADLDEAFAAAAHVVESDDRAEPLHLRADGDPGHHRRRGRRARRDRHRLLEPERCTRPATSSPAISTIPEATSPSTPRDVGGGFGQKMFVFREECAVVLAVAAARPPGEVDRGPPREPDRRRRTPATSRARSRMAIDDRRHHPGDHLRARRPTSAPTPRAPRSMNPALLPGPYKIPRLGLLDVDGVDQHHGQGRVPRPVDVRDDGAGDGDRLAAREIGLDPVELRRKNLLAATPTCRSPSPAGAGVRRDHAARDARAGARDARLRRVPQASRPRPAPRAATSASGSACTSSRPRWPAPRCTPRAPRCASSRAAGSSPTSAPRRTARASRPRWPRSWPTPSASTTTTSPSSRPTRSPRRTGRAPAAAARRSIAGGAARAGGRGGARQGARRSPPTRWKRARRPRDRATASVSVQGHAEPGR